MAACPQTSAFDSDSDDDFSDNFNTLMALFAGSDDEESDEEFDGFRLTEEHNLLGSAVMTGPAVNVSLPSDVELGWSADDSVQPCMPFDTSSRGLQVHMDSQAPLDFFRLLFHDDMWHTLAEQTNLYFEQLVSE